MAFGWYHEAYIDSEAKLWVAAKAKLTSIEVEGVKDGDRPDMVEITNLPKGTKVKQVSFTQNRMFVLSRDGKVYLYKIKQHFPKREDLDLFGASAIPRISGELMINEEPILIKDLPNVQQLDTGLDHILFLTNEG